LFIFFVLSLVIVYLCRNDLRKRGSYGYYRFFTFEFVLLLIMCSIPVWFKDPFSPLQIISWLLIAFALFFGIAGVRILSERRHATPGTAERLVETGVYRLIRHPLYSALVFLSLGLFLKEPSEFWALLLVGIGCTISTTVNAEEESDEKKFGEPYKEYKRRTKRLIPYIY
jgi:protein-S-isoprenylcysteine O-methyltransferase Ste14